MTDEEWEKLQQIKIGIPFKEFLNHITNLLTVFGILNALIAFCTTLNQPVIGSILAGCFYIMSIFVWWEILVMTRDSNDESFKYTVFVMITFIVEIVLVIYFMTQFQLVSYFIIVMIVYFGSIYLVSRLLTALVIRHVRKTKTSDEIKNFISYKNRQKAAFWVLIGSLIIVTAILKLTSLIGIINDVGQKIVQDFVKTM